MFINYPSIYCIKTNITPDQLTNHATWCNFHPSSFVYWTFVYDTYAFWAEQTRWPSMTRSREFPITPVWMIVRFLQVNFIEKITKLDQKAVRYSVLTGYGLFSFFLTKNNKKKFGTKEIVRFRQVFGFIRVRFRQVWLYLWHVFRPAIISRVLENFCIALDESGHHFSSFLFLLHYSNN